MSDKDIARLVEYSEARAYTSLLEADAELSGQLGFRAVRFGNASAIMSENVRTSLNLNRVIGLGLDGPVTEKELDAVCSLYSSAGVSYGIELSPHAEPDNLSEWLRQRRVRKGLSTVLVYRRAGQPEPSPRTLKVCRAGPEYASVVGRICCEVFRMPDSVQSLIAATAKSAEWRHWIAFDENIPAAAALSFVRDKVAWFGWDATLPAYRGRKIQIALIAERLRDAVACGCEWVTAETACGTGERPDPSYRNYKRMGFQEAYLRPTYMAIVRPGK